MLLKFLSKYKSIDTFTHVQLEDFSVFTGKNGSGKTHLLSAIKEGKVQIDNISSSQILYFNFQNFLIKNQKSISPRNIDDEKIQAWDILKNDMGTFEAYDAQIKNITGDIDAPYSQDILNQTYTDYMALPHIALVKLTITYTQYKTIYGLIYFYMGLDLMQPIFIRSGVYDERWAYGRVFVLEGY